MSGVEVKPERAAGITKSIIIRASSSSLPHALSMHLQTSVSHCKDLLVLCLFFSPSLMMKTWEDIFLNAQLKSDLGKT